MQFQVLFDIEEMLFKLLLKLTDLQSFIEENCFRDFSFGFFFNLLVEFRLEFLDDAG